MTEVTEETEVTEVFQSGLEQDFCLSLEEKSTLVFLLKKDPIFMSVYQSHYAHMHVRPYQKLIVWQEAHRLCLWIYRLTTSFPKDERYRLVNQMCKSAYSVPTNIAEGGSKKSEKEREHFYEISACSLEELHYQSRLVYDLGYINQQQFFQADDHIQRVSYLIMRLRKAQF